VIPRGSSRPSEGKIYSARIQTAAAATMLGVSKRTVHALAARGELPGAARIGKLRTFSADKLAQFIADREAECTKNAISTRKRGYGGWAPPLSERKSHEAYERAMSQWLGRPVGGSRRSSRPRVRRESTGDE
jgi:excisionase family DNA binding protein